MAEDEGRMLPPKEARVRRRIASIVKKDTPKPFAIFDKYKFERSSKEAKRHEKINPAAARRYTATVGTKVRGLVENAAAAEFSYHPKDRQLYVSEVYPLKAGEKTFGIESMPELHKEAANKVLSPPVVKHAVTKTAVAFPKARTLVGERVTGAHVRAQEKTGKAINKTQRFNLGGIRKRMGKLGKAGKVMGLGMAAYQGYKGLTEQ